MSVVVHHRYIICLLLLAAWVGDVSSAAAQPAPAATTKSTIQESRPQIFFLRDAAGALQPVLGFSLEDFERLIGTRSNATATVDRPSYQLNELSLTGTAKEHHAELTAKLTLSVDDSTDWVRVPLRMGSAALTDKVVYRGSGEHQLAFDEASGEYVLWLRGGGGKPHELTLPLLVPVETVAGQRRLKLSMPRSLASKLVFAVPTPGASADVSSGAVLGTTRSTAQGTEFEVLGLTSDFQLAWRVGDRATAAPLVLEASGSILARIDGRTIHTRAQLTVRSFGSDFESFRVRLPPGATLVSGSAADYTVEEVSGADPRGRLVEVRLRSRGQVAENVQLLTEQTIDADAKQSELSVTLEGFQVQGAVRQSGWLAVQLTGDWHVLWSEVQMARQVAELPSDLRREEPIAGFEYFAQPFRIAAQLTSRQTRVMVDPTYVISVSAQRVDLEARLRYRIGSTKAQAVDVQMPGWTFDSATAIEGAMGTSLVAVDEIVADQMDPLRIPFVLPTSGDVELVVRAHRALAENEKRLSLVLPRPQAQASSPAQVIVLPTDNVELIPRMSESTSLVRQFTRPAIELPTTQQAPLVFRADRSNAQLVADFRTFSRTMTAEVFSQIRLTEDGGRVEQTISYNIAHEPVESLVLVMPAAVMASEQLEITLDGATLVWDRLDDDAATTGSLVRLRVRLPSPRIGLCELKVLYTLAKETLPESASVQLRVPLMMPGDGELLRNLVRLSSEATVRFQVLDGFWRPEAGMSRSSSADEEVVVLVADVLRNEVLLGVRRAELLAATPSFVSRCWIQSWLGRNTRQDRAVYRLVGPQREFRVRLPAGAKLLSATVAGKVVQLRQGTTADELVIPVMQDAALEANTIELIYRFEQRSAGSGTKLDLRAPRLDSRLDVQQTYWQLVLPGHEFLWSAPSQFSPEYRWSWQGGLWGRAPVMDQFQLENWSGATHLAELPPASNQYLFSAYGPMTQLTAAVVPRTQIVLWGSGCVLLVGLSAMYLPVAKHRVPRFVALVAIGALALVFPEPALVVVQGAALGVMLVAMAVWLKHSLKRRSSRAPSVASPVSSVVERGSAHTQTYPHRTALAGSTSSTATAAAAESPLSESKS